MKILIYENYSILNKRDIIKIIEFYSKELKINTYNTVIHIQFSPRDLAYNVGGNCSYNNKSKSVYIQIRPASLETMLITMAHEMIHAKQFIKGELGYLSSTKIFLGITWKPKKRFIWNGKRQAYHQFNSPWEKEAYAKQDALAGLAYKKLFYINFYAYNRSYYTIENSTSSSTDYSYTTLATNGTF